jgi:large subunit ribosomal protein L5
MSNTASLKKEYAERIAPALKNQFQYSSTMQIPVLKKIVINMGLGMAVADKKIIEVAINELTAITGQKAVATISKKDIANFKLRKKMPIGVMVTLRRERMYEFLEKLVRVALPRIRDFKVSTASSTVEVTILSVLRNKSFSLKLISIVLQEFSV